MIFFKEFLKNYLIRVTRNPAWACSCPRLATMTDQFNWLMEISDPVVASEIHAKRQAIVIKEKSHELPDKAVALLVSPTSSELDDDSDTE